MEKYYTGIVGAAVKIDDEIIPIAFVRDLVIDPENGKVVGFLLSPGRNHVISPVDVVAWGDSLKVHNHDVIVESGDILRVQEILGRRAPVFGAKVVTEKGKNLGRVVDMAIDTSDFSLTKIYVAKLFLGILKLSTRLISARNIIEIKGNKVIVKDDEEKVEEEVAVTEEATAI